MTDSVLARKIPLATSSFHEKFRIPFLNRSISCAIFGNYLAFLHESSSARNLKTNQPVNYELRLVSGNKPPSHRYVWFDFDRLKCIQRKERKRDNRNREKRETLGQSLVYLNTFYIDTCGFINVYWNVWTHTHSVIIMFIFFYRS